VKYRYHSRNTCAFLPFILESNKSFTVMEDEQNLVFFDQGVFYKQVVPPEMVSEVKDMCIQYSKTESIGGIATGTRFRTEIPKDDTLWTHVKTVFRDYFPDIELAENARYYQQEFGGVKPHTDKSLDGRSKYTLLVYLSEFDGGKLSCKLDRLPSEEVSEPEKHHKVFTFTPKMGYGITFRKDYMHWAEEVVAGSKEFLLFDIISEF